MNLESPRHAREVTPPGDVQLLAHRVRPETHRGASVLEGDLTDTKDGIFVRNVGATGDDDRDAALPPLIRIDTLAADRIIPAIAVDIAGRSLIANTSL